MQSIFKKIILNKTLLMDVLKNLQNVIAEVHLTYLDNNHKLGRIEEFPRN